MVLEIGSPSAHMHECVESAESAPMMNQNRFLLHARRMYECMKAEAEAAVSQQRETIN